MINSKKGLAALALAFAVTVLASNARRPFTSAVFWRPDIRSISGATWKFISTGPA
jgi:hypothetical protein